MGAALAPRHPRTVSCMSFHAARIVALCSVVLFDLKPCFPEEGCFWLYVMIVHTACTLYYSSKARGEDCQAELDKFHCQGAHALSRRLRSLYEMLQRLCECLS